MLRAPSLNPLDVIVQFGASVEYVVEADYGPSGSGIGSVLVRRTTTASSQVEVIVGDALLPSVGPVALDVTDPGKSE